MVKYYDLKLGYLCNNNCVHCVVSDQRENSLRLHNKDNRTTKEVFDEILNAKNLGCTSITLTGGEPTIRPDFVEIAKFAKECGLYVLLQSNGRKFCDVNFVNDVKDYVDLYMIALHSSKSEIHDKITQVEGSFLETFEGLKNLVGVGAKVGVKIVISNFNKSDLLKILNLVCEIGIGYVNIAFPHLNGNAMKNKKEICPRYFEIKSELENCILFAEKNKDFILDFEQVLPCLFDEVYSFKYFADVKFKKNEGVVNQLDEGEFTWNDARRNSKRKGVICKSCVYTNFCEGYWKEYVEEFGFSEFKPVRKFSKEFVDLVLKLK